MVNVAPQPLLPQEKRAGTHGIGGSVGSQGGLGRVRKFRPPSEFDVRTFKPVACRYADYAFTAIMCNVTCFRVSHAVRG
jgi:hypothetical protein